MRSGGEHCCVTGCARGGSAHDKSEINRILLRFRPIAPKPVTVDPVSESKLDSAVEREIMKRKYVRFKRKRNVNESESGKRDGMKDIVTLQLLPEKSTGKEAVRSTVTELTEMVEEEKKKIHDVSVSDVTASLSSMSDLRVIMPHTRVVVVESVVTVECVTESCMDHNGRGLGCTDMERMKNLDEDTCPGFVSDGLNKVQWVNGSYKAMMRLQKTDMEELRVRLVMKEKLPWLEVEDAFTCRVKLQYCLGKEKLSQMVPCDVWRMNCGGFAWRLDVTAALSLGR